MTDAERSAAERRGLHYLAHWLDLDEPMQSCGWYLTPAPAFKRHEAPRSIFSSKSSALPGACGYSDRATKSGRFEAPQHG